MTAVGLVTGGKTEPPRRIKTSVRLVIRGSLEASTLGPTMVGLLVIGDLLGPEILNCFLATVLEALPAEPRRIEPLPA